MKIGFVFDEGQKKEDTYLIGKNIFGVFDGTNSINKFFDKSGKSGGLLAAEIVRNEFQNNNKTLEEHLIGANRKLMATMLKEKIDTKKKENLWCTSVAVVRIKEKSFEWLQVEDSLILVIYRDRKFKLLVTDYDHDSGILEIWKEYAKEKRKGIRELVQENVKSLRGRMNEDFGGVNGEEKLLKFIKCGEEPLYNIKHIIIFTDGMIIPKEDSKTPDDFDNFVQLFKEGGLKRILNYIRDLEKDDPECWKYPRYKQYDDIAAISISF